MTHIASPTLIFSHLLKVSQSVRAVFAHFRNQRHPRYQNTCERLERINYSLGQLTFISLSLSPQLTMILFAEQRPCGRQKDLHKFGHTSNDPERTQRRLLPDVRVRTLHQSFHFAGQIACHFWRGDCAQRAQSQSHNELRRTVQVTARSTK